MAITLIIGFIISMAALAPRFGTDSRSLGNGDLDSHTSLPDHD